MTFETKAIGVGSLLFVSAHASGKVTCASVESLAELASRVGDETPASIRERCYSLVQSMAEWDGDKADQPGDAWENEAYRIARDAGWL
jgi:hypothetical protein